MARRQNRIHDDVFDIKKFLACLLYRVLGGGGVEKNTQGRLLLQKSSRSKHCFATSPEKQHGHG